MKVLLNILFVFVIGVLNAQESTSKVVEVKIVPNYEDNLTLFYAMCVLTAILGLAIYMGKGAMKSLINSEKWKENVRKYRSEHLKKMVLLLAVSFTGKAAMALSVAPEPEEAINRPWLLIETEHLYIYFGFLLVLLGVFYYVLKTYWSLVRMAELPKNEVVKESEVTNRIVAALTDIVPIEKENEILMDHDYDGIQELDNNLPPWWLYGFYACILFAFIYLIDYHLLGISPLQIEEYEIEMAEKELEVQAYLDKMAMNVDEKTATVMTEASDISAGSSIFQNNCVACHLPDGSGSIGPNLTDKNWIYGFDIKDLFKTVKNGTANGMPEHKSKLNPIQIQQVTSFVLQMPEKAGKDPEGEIIE